MNVDGKTFCNDCRWCDWRDCVNETVRAKHSSGFLLSSVPCSKANARNSCSLFEPSPPPPPPPLSFWEKLRGRRREEDGRLTLHDGGQLSIAE